MFASYQKCVRSQTNQKTIMEYILVRLDVKVACNFLEEILQLGLRILDDSCVNSMYKEKEDMIHQPKTLEAFRDDHNHQDRESNRNFITRESTYSCPKSQTGLRSCSYQ